MSGWIGNGQGVCTVSEKSGTKLSWERIGVVELFQSLHLKC